MGKNIKRLTEKKLEAKSSRCLFISSVALCILSVGCGKIWGSVTDLRPPPTSTTVTQYIYGLYSNIFRDVGSTQLTQTSEVTTYAGNGSSSNLPGNYREVPNILTDDDGYCNTETGCFSECAIVVSVTGAQHAAFVDCGAPLTSIIARISDCSAKNGSGATWLGSVNSIGAQGNWSLVTRQGANNEVWQDQITGLLWSSRLTPAIIGGDNWCRASGNAQAADPSNICNSMTYQPEYPVAESDCAEAVGAVPTPGWCSDGTAYTTALGCTGAGGTWTANPDNWVASTYSPQKGGMGANSATLKVRWRLPTTNDFNQADIDGLRYVMPDLGAFELFVDWTSTVYSLSRISAWIYGGRGGNITLSNRTSNYMVRCVGR